MSAASPTGSMKAAEYDRYGAASVTLIRDVKMPALGADQVLVQVHAAALNPKDVLLRMGKVPLLSGLGFPKRLGYDFSGRVVALGPRAEGVREGDAVYGMIQAHRAGALSEYIVLPATQLAPKPERLSWEEAAALPLASLTALQALRDVARLRAGQRLLVNGASGGVGVSAVQIGKALGAEVIGVSSAKNRELALALGCTDWLDYQTQDIFEGGPYDVILDAFGNRSFDAARRALAPRGSYVSTVPNLRLGLAIVRTVLRAQRARLVVVQSRRRDLELLSSLVDRGALRAVIAQSFAFSEVVAAQELVETKRARGKVVIRIMSDLG